ncbi:MAG: FxsA family protein [Bacillota bacterium]
MLIKLLLIFSLVPLLEFMLLIELSGVVGLAMTILLVAGTGVVGISIARGQGLALIENIKGKLNQGQMPKNQLLDGGLLLFGSALLLTPGLITDVLGFLAIIPFTRPLLRKVVKHQISSSFSVSYGSNQKQYDNYNQNNIDEEIIDITDYEEIDEEDQKEQ